VTRTSVVFTGYAPVHFLCFRPVYERLARRPDVELWVSGGLRAGTEGGFAYDGPGLYRRFGVPEERILPVEALARRRFDVVFAANRRVIVPRENAGALVQIFHGVSFRNRGVREENLAFDHLFLTGPYMRRLFAERGLLAERDPRGVPVGFPKTDALLAGDGAAARAAVLAAHGFDGSRPVLLFAPTGEADNALETMGEELVRRLAAAGRYDLIVKPHDHPKRKDVDWRAALGRLEDAHTRLARGDDVVPLLRASDLLITDASSVANEFALLDRPIVFADVPALIARAERAANGTLDLQTWGRKAGPVGRDAAEVAEAVADSLARPERHGEIRRAIAADLFYNPGRATDAAIAWLEERFLSGGARRLAS
jgi:hypothetical protein